MKSLEELFPVDMEGRLNTHFGISRYATQLRRDQQHTRLIGMVADFKLPDDYIRVIIDKVDRSEGYVAYVPMVARLPKNTPPLCINIKDDNLIRRIIKDPKTYTKSKVYAKSKLREGTFELWPVTYVGQRRIVIQTPIVPKSSLKG